MNQVKVNIPRSVQDPAYRYQMPLLQQRIIGRGINIRTEFLNLKDVATALFIGPEYILKFMGIEFGSKSTLKRDKQTNEIQVTSINGKFSEDDVLNCLDKFIDKFILCQNDKLPEMRISVDKGEVVGKCNACGHLTKIDPVHKLTAYMQKHPPKQGYDIKTTKDQQQKQKQELNEQNTKRQKYQIREQLKQTDLNPKNEQNKEIFDNIWEYLNMILKIEDDFVYEDTQTERLYKGIKRLRMKKEYYDKVGFIAFNFIFDSKIFTQIDQRAILFEQFLIRHKMNEYISQETALNLTFFCYQIHKEQSWDKFLPTMMKKFLDQDLFKKEFLLKWAQKDPEVMNFFQKHCLFVEEYNNKILQVCQPFFAWLKDDSDEESEEDESGEEGSDDDEESEENNQQFVSNIFCIFYFKFLKQLYQQMELNSQNKQDIQLQYKLFLDLSNYQTKIQNNDIKFQGQCQYKFKNLCQNNIVLDFKGKILDVKGAICQKIEQNKYQIILDNEQNIFQINFEFKIQDRNEGLYYWEMHDNYYITSQSEPNFVSLFMPCYEQFSQNVKLQLFIRTNKKLQVIANSQLQDIISQQQLYDYGFNTIEDLVDQEIHQFQIIDQLPSRLIALSAGNYQIIYENQLLTKNKKSINLRLLIPDQKNQNEFNDLIKLFCFISLHVIYYIEEYFQIQFPLDKLDYVFCNSNYNGMENVGMIVINLGNLYNQPFLRGEFYEYIRQRLISHELMHTIFGHQLPIKEANCMFFKEGCNEFINNKFQEYFLKIIPSDQYIYDKWNLYTLQRALTDNLQYRQKLQQYETQVTQFTYSGQTYQQTLRLFRNLDKIYGQECIKQYFQNFFKKYRNKLIIMQQIIDELKNHLSQQDIVITKIIQDNLQFSNQQIFQIIFEDYFNTTIFPVVEFNCFKLKQDGQNYLTFKTKYCKQLLLNIVFLDQNNEKIKQEAILFLNLKENQLNKFKIDFDFENAYVIFNNFGYYYLKYDQNSLQFIKDLNNHKEAKDLLDFFEELNKINLFKDELNEILSFNQISKQKQI